MKGGVLWRILLPLSVVVLLVSGAPSGAVDECPEEDTLKLLPGAKDGERQVLVCRDGEWKRVCDNGEGWTKEDAIVTCRQLQYPHPEYAESLGAYIQVYDSDADETVPNCHGDESRLSDCPTHPIPENCDINCALVNCVVPIPESTSSIRTSSTVATDSRSTSQASFTSSVTKTSPYHTLTPSPSSPGHLHIPTNQTVTKLPVTMSTSYEPSNSVTFQEHDVSNDTIFTWNAVTVAVIGGVVMTIVTAGITASACLVACSVKGGRKYRKKKSGELKIKTQPNVAYVTHRTKIITKTNPAHVGMPPEPIYEHIYY